MELLGDELVRVPRSTLTAAAALALASFLTVGCGSGSAPPADTPWAVTPVDPAGAPSSAVESEEARGNRAKGLLEKIDPDAPEFVASGLERVPDGVHARSSLTKGETYRISVACVGTGTVVMEIERKDPQSIPCDGVLVSRQVQNSPQELPIDITSGSGATGMVAWQITAVSS